MADLNQPTLGSVIFADIEKNGQPLRGHQGKAGRPCLRNPATRHPQAGVRAVHHDAGKPARRGDGLQRGPLGKPGRIPDGVRQR